MIMAMDNTEFLTYILTRMHEQKLAQWYTDHMANHGYEDTVHVLEDLAKSSDLTEEEKIIVFIYLGIAVMLEVQTNAMNSFINTTRLFSDSN